jgi:hypothetical protein
MFYACDVNLCLPTESLPAACVCLSSSICSRKTALPMDDRRCVTDVVLRHARTYDICRVADVSPIKIAAEKGAGSSVAYG